MQFLDCGPCEAALFAWFTKTSQACVQLTSNDTIEHVAYLGLTFYNQEVLAFSFLSILKI